MVVPRIGMGTITSSQLFAGDQMGNLFPLSPSISFPFELFASQQGFTLPSPDCHAPFCAPVDCVNIDADRISL